MPNIDLTPLQDVLLVSVISIIMILPFEKERSIDLHTPYHDNHYWSCIQRDDVLVQIDRHNIVWVNGKVMTDTSLRALFESSSHRDGFSLGLIVRAHIDSSVKKYIAVSQSARQARINNIQLIPFS